MIYRLLPQEINNTLINYDMQKIQEIRLRRNAPVVINYQGKNCVLKRMSGGEPVFVTKEMIEYVLKRATENSLYAYNNQIKQGFITARGGIRLGIAGESVNSDKFMPTTIKNINSINIRVPHEVKDCSAFVFNYIYSKDYGIKNSLIISPPGAGKTTYLRDIARKISGIEDKVFNTLLVDERFELASTLDGEPMLDVGTYTDIVSGASKEFAFSNGIRVLRPDIIITDELMSEADVDACINAVNSGVKVIASIHANSISELKERQGINKILTARCFERYFLLSNKNKVGECISVYDENHKCIYF